MPISHIINSPLPPPSYTPSTNNLRFHLASNSNFFYRILYLIFIVLDNSKKLFPSTQTPRGDQLAQDNAAGHNFNFLTNHTTFPLQNAIVFHQGKINKRFKTSRGNKVGYFEPDISASCLPLVPTSKLIQ